MNRTKLLKRKSCRCAQGIGLVGQLLAAPPPKHPAPALPSPPGTMAPCTCTCVEPWQPNSNHVGHWLINHRWSNNIPHFGACGVILDADRASISTQASLPQNLLLYICTAFGFFEGYTVHKHDGTLACCTRQPGSTASAPVPAFGPGGGAASMTRVVLLPCRPRRLLNRWHQQRRRRPGPRLRCFPSPWPYRLWRRPVPPAAAPPRPAACG